MASLQTRAQQDFSLSSILGNTLVFSTELLLMCRSSIEVHTEPDETLLSVSLNVQYTRVFPSPTEKFDIFEPLKGTKPCTQQRFTDGGAARAWNLQKWHLYSSGPQQKLILVIKCPLLCWGSLGGKSPLPACTRGIPDRKNRGRIVRGCVVFTFLGSQSQPW